MTKLLIALLAGACLLGTAATAPEAADCETCQDIPLLQRYPGSFLVGAEAKAFDEATLPTGAYVETPEFTYEFPDKRTFEGRIDKLFYHGPQGRSGLEVYANTRTPSRRPASRRSSPARATRSAARTSPSASPTSIRCRPATSPRRRASPTPSARATR